MGVINQVAVALAGYSVLAAAVPFEARAPTNSFTLNQVAAHKKPFVNGARHYQKALLKYGATVPDHVATAAAAAVSGSATNTPESGDTEYLTPVTIGTTTLNLDFDTGSADLWVFSSELPSSEQTGHSIYTPSSSAAKIQGASWKISYGDGSGANGDVYTDTVSVGAVTATSQAVEAAQSISAQFQQDTDNDGLLGLAFSSINTVSPTPQTTFFDTVKSNLDKPLFAVTLKHQAPGSYDFGFIDVQKYTGQIAYTPVDSSQGFWGFTVSGYSVGGSNSTAKLQNNRHIAPRTSIAGIADTGTTLLLLPDNVVTDYYGQVSGATNDASAGGYTFPCDASLPDLTFTIGSYNAVVPGSLINLQQQGSSCFGGLQSSAGIGTNIFGDVFLKSQYVVFDSEGPQLGFAPQA